MRLGLQGLEKEGYSPAYCRAGAGHALKMKHLRIEKKVSARRWLSGAVVCPFALCDNVLEICNSEARAKPDVLGWWSVISFRRRQAMLWVLLAVSAELRGKTQCEVFQKCSQTTTPGLPAPFRSCQQPKLAAIARLWLVSPRASCLALVPSWSAAVTDTCLLGIKQLLYHANFTDFEIC